MGLIAFYNPKTGVCEFLQQHLEDVTREISTRFLPKRTKLLAKLLKSYVDIDLDSIKRAILYAGIFHDVGKAYYPFQETLRHKGTAPHHEVFSVFFSDKVLTKLGKELKTIVLLAIAWHHSSTRGAVLERMAGTTNRFLQVDSVRLNEDSRMELSEILGNIFSHFKCGEEADLSNIPATISVKDIENLLNDLGRSIRREKRDSYRAYYVTLPLLTALQVADAKVSFENRKTSPIPPIHIRDITNLDAERRIVQTLMKL
jgi:CRISPR-associated endonuclease Cas3-HD